MRTYPAVPPTMRKLLPLLVSATWIVFGHPNIASAAEIAVGDLKLSDSCIRATLPGAQVAGAI